MPSRGEGGSGHAQAASRVPELPVLEDELRRTAAERTLAAMSDHEFAEACEQFFAKRPGLRRFFAGTDRTSRGLTLVLVDALCDGTISFSPVANPLSCSAIEVASSPTQPLP